MRFQKFLQIWSSLPHVKATKSPTDARLLVNDNNNYWFDTDLTGFAIPWNLRHFFPLQGGRLYAINYKAPHAKLANDLEKSNFHFHHFTDRQTYLV